MTVLTETSAIRCQKCRTVYRKPNADLRAEVSPGSMSDAAAARAVGWTVWEGQTIGGREDRRVFCVICAGRTDITDQALAKATTWDAKCNTCDATATEYLEADLPLSEDDVKNWKSDHQCEPWVELVKPKVVADA